MFRRKVHELAPSAASPIRVTVLRALLTYARARAPHACLHPFSLVDSPSSPSFITARFSWSQGETIID